MKKLILPILTLFIVACNSNSNKTSDLKSESAIVNSFLNDISSLENIEKNPIEVFQKAAETDASEVIDLTKNNIQEVIAKAKTHNSCVITVGNHTIVKLTDVADCKQSRAWGNCMPFAEGYIKKGTLILQEDYINNIIGLPDSQLRKAYLFK